MPTTTQRARIAGVSIAVVLMASACASQPAQQSPAPTTTPLSQEEWDAKARDMSREDERGPAPTDRAEPWVAGVFLDENADLTARVFADAPTDLAPEDFLTAAGTPMRVLPSVYTRQELADLSDSLEELITEGSGGFYAEYDGARDLYVIVGDLDAEHVAQVLGDVRYEFTLGEGVRHFLLEESADVD